MKRFLNIRQVFSWRKQGRRYTLKERIVGKHVTDKQDEDIAELNTVSKLMESLCSAPLSSSHPLRPISQSLKEKAAVSQAPSLTEQLNMLENLVDKALLNYNDTYTSYPVTDAEEALCTKNYVSFQSALRLDFFKRYCAYLREAIEAGELKSSALPEGRLLALIDSTLMGSGAERNYAHLRLYNSAFTPARLQCSFYTLYNPEVEAAVNAAKSLPLSTKKIHTKAIPKSSKTYLLDKLELNVMSRCVFAWSDPKYSGFKQVDDNDEMLASDIYIGRQQYFDEGNSIAKKFVDAYIASRHEHYNGVNEFRKNVLYGSVFLVVICALDWHVCNM